MTTRYDRVTYYYTRLKVKNDALFEHLLRNYAWEFDC